jgi:hypothetical protein
MPSFIPEVVGGSLSQFYQLSLITFLSVKAERVGGVIRILQNPKVPLIEL